MAAVTVDLDKLEQLARAATPGPWEAPTQPESVVNVWTTASEAAIRASDVAAHGQATGAAVFHELGNGIAQDIRGPDAAFIAAANPAALLELLARLRAQVGEGGTARELDEAYLQRKQMVATIGTQERELERLRAIVRDLAARHRRFIENGMPDDPCQNCDGTWTSHAPDCCGARAVEATKL